MKRGSTYTYGYRRIFQLFHLCSCHGRPPHLSRQLLTLFLADAARIDARFVDELTEVAELADRREVRTALWRDRGRVTWTVALRQTVGARADAGSRSWQRPDEWRDLRQTGVTVIRTRRCRTCLRQEVRLHVSDERRPADIRLSDSGQSTGTRFRLLWVALEYGLRGRRRWRRFITARRLRGLGTTPLGNGQQRLGLGTSLLWAAHVASLNRGGLEWRRPRPVLGRRANVLVDTVSGGAHGNTRDSSIRGDIRRHADLVVAVMAAWMRRPLLEELWWCM